MAGPTVYHGVAQKVYLVKEAVIGMSLGLVAGAVWKYSHWERRKEIQSYYDKKSSKWSLFSIRSIIIRVVRGREGVVENRERLWSNKTLQLYY